MADKWCRVTLSDGRQLDICEADLIELMESGSNQVHEVDPAPYAPYASFEDFHQYANRDEPNYEIVLQLTAEDQKFLQAVGIAQD